jgi:hypothetical protein
MPERGQKHKNKPYSPGFLKYKYPKEGRNPQGWGDNSFLKQKEGPEAANKLFHALI